MFCVCGPFDDAISSSDHMLVNDELERLWKETFIA
jgi:hypothetical protein